MASTEDLAGQDATRERDDVSSGVPDTGELEEGHARFDPVARASEEANNGEMSSVMGMFRAMMSRMDENNRKMDESNRKMDENMAEIRDALVRGVSDAMHYTDKACADVTAEARQYVEESCATLREDLKADVEACHTRIAQLHRVIEEQVVVQSAVPQAGLPTWQPPRCLATRCGAHEEGKTSPPASPPTPKRQPCSLTPPRSPPRHTGSPMELGTRRKPSEFDGRVAWEAYLAQFELVADAQGWSVDERALQLVASLRGAALEVLGHFTGGQPLEYQQVVEALRRRFGHHQQSEVYRARLKARVRAKGEPLPQLAQELETLVRRAYPAASEDMVRELAKDQFVDALQDRELQLYVKQAHPKDMKEALARALELEAFLRTSVGAVVAEAPRKTFPVREFRARRAQAPTTPTKKQKEPSRSGRSSPVGFRGACWSCGQKGHKRSQCRKGQRTRSLERPATSAFQPCCRSCGEYGHFSIACTNPKDVMQAGNGPSLAGGATTQPASWGPLAI